LRINLVLIGPPGCGKGTQAVRLARHFGVPHISTGDILRDAVRADSPLGRQVATTIASGSLASDALMGDLVRERLAQPDAASGFVLDGFPRTLVQAELLQEMLPAPIVVALIDASDDEIVRRLARRRVCDSCRITQSASGNEHASADPCPYCGGQLVRREDDEPRTVRHRLATYASFAEPVISHYRIRPGFVSIDGTQEPDAVTRALIAAITQSLDALMTRTP
jgi:adenylate kinase